MSDGSGRRRCAHVRAVEAMERDFDGIRTGRASTALVERLQVEYYGTQTPLNQLAGISVPEATRSSSSPGIAACWAPSRRPSSRATSASRRTSTARSCA